MAELVRFNLINDEFFYEFDERLIASNLEDFINTYRSNLNQYASLSLQIRRDTETGTKVAYVIAAPKKGPALELKLSGDGNLKESLPGWQDTFAIIVSLLKF